MSMESLLKDYGWHEWLCHSNFSFLAGAAHPEGYVRQALDYGYAGLGLCDYDGVYGIVRAHRELERQRRDAHPQAETFCLCLGAEIHLSQEHHLPPTLRHSVVLYALNFSGYKELCRLLSISHKDTKDRAYLDLDALLSGNLQNLLAIVPMRGYVRRRSDADWYRFLEALVTGFPADNLCLHISRHFNPSEDRWIPRVLQASTHFDRPWLASSDCYFLCPEDKMLSDLLQAIRVNRTVDQASYQMFINDQRCLHPQASLANSYGDIPGFAEALKVGKALRERFVFDLGEIKYRYPEEMIPEGYDAQSYLTHLTWESARKKYGAGIPERVRSLLEKELSLVASLGFADYFLTVWDIVNWARSKDILCQGRGSAANSAICFVLGITAVDPSLFDVLFERFMSAERGDPPDIDVDFENERREEVIQYIYGRYGRDRCAMVANVITFRSKGAIRFTGKALGVPDRVLNKAASLLRDRRGRSPSLTIEQLEEEPGDEIPWDLWANLSEKLKGFPRHMGLHSGGFIISNEPLHYLSACEPATMEGRTVIQWSKDDIESLGFFKIDVLALGMLTAIRKCLELVKSHYQIDGLCLATIPQDCPETYDMICRADTVGTFQIESRAQMAMLPKHRPRRFYDLVVQVGIIRPGPIQGGLVHPYLRRRRGEEPVTYPDERLVPILQRTLGVPIFQEQVMRIAIAIGGFSPGEADELRRHMGSWSFLNGLGQWSEKLAKGMMENGIEANFARQILGQMKGFAEYGFPESHAASFALIAYASSYLKCHFQAAFTTALLNSQPMGFYSPHALLSDARRHGVEVAGLSVNHSDWDHKLEPVSGHQSYRIRLGFRMVRGLRKDHVERMLAYRERHGPWECLQDFLQTVPLYQSDLSTLAACRALEDFGLDRRSAYWVCEAAPFAPLLEEELLTQRLPSESPFDASEQDFDAFGTSLGLHPVVLLKRDCWLYDFDLKRLSTSRQLSQRLPNQIVYVFGMVLVRQSPGTANGMVFVTLEDETGFLNAVFYPQVFDRYRTLVVGRGFLLLEARLQKQDGSESLLVKRVFDVSLNDARVVTLIQAQDSAAPTAALGQPGTREIQKTRNFH